MLKNCVAKNTRSTISVSNLNANTYNANFVFQMPIMMQKKYSNAEITVIWKPEVCQHSTHCWKGLINVFDPRKKPWINMDGDTSGRIIEQVKKCPSGALSYVENSTTDTESKTPST